MAPKRRPCLLATGRQDLETLDQHRFRLGIAPPPVVPAPVAALASPVTSLSTTTRSLSRSDAPDIKHARRGDVTAALQADSTVGFDVLLANSVHDCESASGAGGRAILSRT